jgi:hypothetical protein
MRYFGGRDGRPDVERDRRLRSCGHSTVRSVTRTRKLPTPKKREPDGYTNARRIRILRTAISAVLPVFAFVIQVRDYPYTDEVAAAAGLWLLLDRIVLQTLDDRFRRAGATEQRDEEEWEYQKGIEPIRGYTIRESAKPILETSSDVLVDEGGGCAKAAAYYGDYARVAQSYAVFALVAAALLAWWANNHLYKVIGTGGTHHSHLAQAVILMIPVLPALLDVTDFAGSVREAQLAFNALAEIASTALACPLDDDSRRQFARIIQTGRFEERSRAPATSNLFFKSRFPNEYKNLRDTWTRNHPVVPGLTTKSNDKSEPTIAGE